MSDAEEALVFQVRALKLPPPEREWKFDPVRRWRFDFFWPDHNLAVEVEGGRWTGGRHTRPLAFEQDCIKYAEAALRGITVLRVTPEMVDDGRAISYVEKLLAARTLDGNSQVP